MKKKKLFFSLAVFSTLFASHVQANEPWEWSGADCVYEYDDCCCEGKILFLSEFLWWTPGDYAPFANNVFLNDGAAVASPTAPFPSVVDTANAPYVRISEKWSMGTRIGLGWESCEGWQTWGVWTGYSNYARRVLNATPPAPPVLPVAGGLNEGVILFPVLGDDFDLPTFPGLSATATYKLNYNIADLVFGKSICFWDCLEVMPYAGVRAAFIHQRDALKLQGLTTPAPLGATTFIANVGANTKAFQDLWAVGPRLGVGATFGNWQGFNLIGNISAAILYGRMEQGYQITQYAPFAIDGITRDILTLVTTTEDNYNLIVPNLQVQLGFGYDFEISLFSSQYNVNFFALWEGNTYWGASSRLLFERQLSLNGLTTGCAISF